MTRDRGSALILALLAAALISALGLGLLLVTDTERLVAASYERSLETVYAADALGASVAGELQSASDWSLIVNGTVVSRFTDSTHRPVLPSVATVNLDAITADVQSQSDARGPGGANRPVWNLFSWGPLARLRNGSSLDSGAYVAAWVADDRFDVDGKPLADSNDTVGVHVEAFGWASAHRVVELVVSRTPEKCEPDAGYWPAVFQPTGTIRMISFTRRIGRLQNCARVTPAGAPRLVSWREIR